MPKTKRPKIIIEGITQDGKVFRPRDWVERVCGTLSTFKNHRIYYSALLKPSYKDGNRCVVIDPELKERNPALFHQIVEFAIVNNLKMTEEDHDKK